MKSLFERLRTRRLASMFILLATLSAAIVTGSYAAHGVRGQEKQNDSTDATPLKVNNSTVAPNQFGAHAHMDVEPFQEPSDLACSMALSNCASR